MPIKRSRAGLFCGAGIWVMAATLSCFQVISVALWCIGVQIVPHQVLRNEEQRFQGVGFYSELHDQWFGPSLGHDNRPGCNSN